MEKIESRGKQSPACPPSPPPDPVFQSAHAALKFALNFSHGTLKRGVLAQLQGGGGSDRGLAGLDGAAQSGMIQAELLELHSLHRHVLIGRFTSPSAPCACRAPCCRGAREGGDWGASVDYVTEYVLVAGLTGTISHFRLRRALVKRYFGVKESFIEMAKACGVHRTTASEYNKAVAEHLRGEERVAFRDIEARLRRAGIVGA